MEPDRATGIGEGERQQRPRLVFVAVSSGGLLGGGLGYLGLVNPHSPNSVYPRCLFKLLTGWDCPACGGLRMVYDLLHGDLVAGINDNFFLLVGIPLLIGGVLLGRRRGQPWPRLPVVLTILTAAAAWTVLRNLPGFPYEPAMLGG